MLTAPAWRGAARAEGSATLVLVPSQMSLQSAISSVANGGVIEIAAGTYTAPANGFNFGNLGKSFTVRAATGANVVLSGGGNTQVLRFQNSAVSGNGVITFDRITFANGYSNTEGIAGGATLYKAQAIFNNCVFRDNVAVVNTTVGGGIYVADNSTVTFSGCRWENNSSRVGGAGLGIRSNSVVYVSSAQFLNNNASPPNHTPTPTGGAINLGNSTLYVSHSRFEGNKAGAHGGAIEVIGSWQTPYSTPRAYAEISNSTFINNKAERHASVSGSLPNEGGALAIEDQSLVKVYDSYFFTNTAMIGGAITLYRGSLEVYRSQFLGNRAAGDAITNGFGGAISATSGDSPADGSNNRPVAKLTVETSYFQGRYASVGTTAFTGGCLHSYGDGYRVPQPGPDDGVPNMGTIAENRGQVTIRNTIFNDCDAQAIQEHSGVGGAVSGGLTNFVIDNSLFMRSDALGPGEWGSGGAVAVFDRTLLTITNSAFARNTANRLGAALFAQGSEISISGSQFFENEISPGVTEGSGQSYGAAIFTGVDEYRGLPATGTVQNNVFSNNLGVDIFDDDRNSPINATTYNANQFYASDYNGLVYTDSLAGSRNVAGLNSLVVTRSGSSTDKSPANNNTALGSAPILGKILAVAPALLLPAGASADGPAAHVGYAWSGGSATLNGNAVSGNAGVLPITSGGTYTLNVNGSLFSVEVGGAAYRIFVPFAVR